MMGKMTAKITAKKLNKANNTKEKKLFSNDGFSLVELLIAITILSIIVAPLLHGIVSALNTNAKARKTMQATQIAEDIMEKFEAHSIEEMESVYTASGSGYTVDYGGVANKGYLKITGTDSSASSGTYNVEITLDSSAYKNAVNGLNDLELADIQNLSGSTNAVYMDSATEIAAAYGYFTNYAQSGASGIESHVTRNIEINITGSPISLDLGSLGTVITDVYTVTASVQYSCDAAYLQDYAPSKYPQNPNEYIIFTNEADVRQQAEDIKAGTSTQTEIVSRLANIVVCLQPRKTGGDDYLSVNNADNVATNLYLVMQGEDSDINDAGCKVHFDLYEAAGSWIAASGADSTVSYCRLRSNMLKNSVVYYGYHNINNNSYLSGQAYISTDADGNFKKDSTTGEYVYTQGINFGGNGVTALKILQADSLVPTHKYNRIYEIKVEVYAEGDTSPIVSMTGTVTDNIKAD